MSRDARQCDRCGNLYKEYGIEKHDNNAVMFVSLNMDGGYLEDIPKDLCPECMEKLNAFMDSKTYASGEIIALTTLDDPSEKLVETVSTNYDRLAIYTLVKKIAAREGGFKNTDTVLKEIYKELEKRFGLNLNECLARQRKILASKGNNAEKYTMLDLIYSETCTRDEYIKIVLEKARKHGISV